MIKMTRFVVILFFASSSMIHTIAIAAPEEPNQIDHIITTKQDSKITVIIESSRPLQYYVSEKSKPAAILIHLMNDVLHPNPIPIAVNHSLLHRIYFETNKPPASYPEFRRVSTIVLELKKRARFQVKQQGWTLSIKLQPEYRNTDDFSRANTVNTLLVEDWYFPGLELPENPSIDDFIKVGLTNHAPLDTARKELKLAKKRYFEAKRTFFPVMKARLSETDGRTLQDPNDLATVSEFRRRELGLELGQPLFQSGRIYYGAKQARASSEAAESQIHKLSSDLMFEIKRAVYNYLQLKNNLIMRQSLQKEAMEMVGITAKKKEIGLSSRTEYLGTVASAAQIDYRLLSHENDLDLAKTTLQGVINVKTIPDTLAISLEQIFSEIPESLLKYEELLNKALSFRPEVRAAYYRRKAQEYGRKSIRGENFFRVDVSGFIGQSGAAFRGEDLELEDSYNIGVRAVMYFGGSSLTPLISREKTAPDLGSTSRTETNAKSVSLGILDSLGSQINVLSATIEEEKAREELRKIRKEITLEVKEAYFNYTKGRSQIDSAYKELKYRQVEAEIAQTRQQLQQVDSTQLLQALSALTEAEVSIIEAKTFIVIAIAALEKATGSQLNYRW